MAIFSSCLRADVIAPNLSRIDVAKEFRSENVSASLLLIGRNADGACVVLIVAGRFEAGSQRDPYGSAATAPASDSVDSLALLAGRGHLQRRADSQTVARMSHNSWQLNLLDALALDASEYPSAPVSALGASDTQVTGYWLHAEPVHLAAGMDSLTFARLTGATAMTAAERQVLAPMIASHLEGSAFQLQVSDAGDWLVQSLRQLDVTTVSPDGAAAAELRVVMPSGSDAGELRRLMTEWQMLLHEHPVSERRQRRGLPAVNAVWPWGSGVVCAVQRRSLPTLLANDAFTRGIARMHGVSAASLPANATAALADISGHVVIVIEPCDLRALESDWLAPLVAAVRSKHIARLDVLMDEWHLHATAGMLRRFWRKPRPRTHWT